MLKPGPGTEWLFRKISQALQIHNERFYGYKLEFVQDLQYTEYPEGEGYYGAHQDWGSAVYNGRDDLCRKLSFTIQLSDPSTYDGGDLHIYYGEDFTLEAQRLRAQGTLITFPSFMLHEVKPVTRGIRRSLVGWCMGPDYQ